MRTATYLLVSVGLALASSPASNDDSPAKPPAEKPSQVVTFLGVHAVPLDPALRAQLDLPDGVGMLVRSVAPESPAAKAGVKPHDVLHKLDDQLLINADQLVVLVRIHSPGDAVELTLIRKAKPTLLTVTLGSRKTPAPPDVIERFRRSIPPRLRPDRMPRPDWRMPEWPPDFDEEMRKRIERHLRQWKRQLPPAFGGPPTHAKPNGPDKAPKPGKPHKPDKPQAKPDPDHAPKATMFVLKTPKYTITVVGVGARQKATIADSKGKILHQDVPAGKWDTLPDDLQKLLKGIRIHKANGNAKVRVRV